MYSPNYLNQSKQILRNIGAKSVSTRKISDIKIELKIINILILLQKIAYQLFLFKKVYTGLSQFWNPKIIFMNSW